MESNKENLSELEDVTESIFDVTESIFNTVSIAILEHLGETGGCEKEDMVDLDAIEKESESVIEGLKEFKLIKVEGNVVEMTEEGRKFLENLQELKEILEG